MKVFILSTLLLTSPITAPIEVYFSPKGGSSEAIIAEIDKAKTEIHVQAYSFTSAPIAKALIDAKDRGVKVFVILDKKDSHGKYSEKDFLSHSGIETWLDGQHPIAHAKIILIEPSTIITGSYNYSKQAELNSENLLIIQSKELYEKYISNWSNHLSHSEKYNL